MLGNLQYPFLFFHLLQTNILQQKYNHQLFFHQKYILYFDGKIVDGYTFVELYWFARDEKIKKEVADFLTKFIKKINNNKDCCIIFFTLTGDNYCDNGEFF